MFQRSWLNAQCAAHVVPSLSLESSGYCARRLHGSEVATLARQFQRAIQAITQSQGTAMIKSTGTFILASAAAAALSTPADAQTATTSRANSAKNIVLVHGAFADGSGWRGVYDELTERGYRVTIVQNPLTSLADDVAATKRSFARQDGPAILVDHAWGGVVIAVAGTHSIVIGLVYVSALSPDAGETTGQQYQGFAAT